MKKKRKQNSSTINLLIGVVAIVIIFLIIVLVFGSTNKTETEKELNKEGYTTTNEEDPFYKKVVTNNTLDDYFDDIANNKDSLYEEYYLAKESLNLIELKMSYHNNITTTLNITSDLRTQDVKFDYELSYNKAYLLINGSSKDNYSCQVVTQKNVGDNVVKEKCNDIMEEISTFLERREILLQNDKVRELVNEPPKEYIERDN